MANPEPTSGSIGQASSPPMERLRTLTDTEVVLLTHDGECRGVVLSCTRSSVWLVGAGDIDVVVPIGEILTVSPARSAA